MGGGGGVLVGGQNPPFMNNKVREKLFSGISLIQIHLNHMPDPPLGIFQYIISNSLHLR